MWYWCAVGVKAIMSDELHLAPTVVRCKRIRKHPSANQPRLTTASCSFEFIGISAITCFTCLSSTVTNVYIDAQLTRAESSESAYIARISVVVKDLRLKDKDKDEDLKIGPRGSSRTRTFLEDNNTAVRQYGEIDMNLNLTGAQWQISHPFVTQSLQDDDAWYFACYVSLLNPRKFSRTWTSEDEDKDNDLKIGHRRSSRTTTLARMSTGVASSTRGYHKSSECWPFVHVCLSCRCYSTSSTCVADVLEFCNSLCVKRAKYTMSNGLGQYIWSVWPNTRAAEVVRQS